MMAEITYRVIEVPGIKLGRRVIGAMRGNARQTG
jgi:peptidoglycan/LPS O-acetylase OafA/YrhL